MTNKLFNQEIVTLLKDPTKQITILTGAGISAESGIPTFRGPEGYWTIGSKVYMPQEVATMAMFRQHPRAVWEWYLYRLGVCLEARPNAGHNALVELERKLGHRFTLITQNIDNLHIRAGNSLERTYQIHGNINFTRCSDECTSELFYLANELRMKRKQKELNDDELELLHCSLCGAWLRPHVLWFDEYYDEEHFRFDSSMAKASSTDLLIVVGTSGATALPNNVVSMVYQNGKTIVDINPEQNPFSAMALSSKHGLFIPRSAAKVLPELARTC